MRRRLLWIGLTTLVVVGILGALLLNAPGIDSFEFLQAAQLHKTRWGDTYYDIKADWKTFEAEARKELSAEGYRDVTEAYGMEYERVFVSSIGPKVYMVKNYRIEDDAGAHAPGWVLIQVSERKEPGLLQRLRSWFGL